MPTFDDDVDGWHGRSSISRQRRFAVDSAKNSAADLVIHRGRREHFDIILDRRDAFYAFNNGLGISLQRGTDHLTAEDDLASFHSVREVIEDGIIGQQNEL